MAVPGTENRFWVFSGDQYLLIEVAADATARGRLQEPRPITDWPPFQTD